LINLFCKRDKLIVVTALWKSLFSILIKKLVFPVLKEQHMMQPKRTAQDRKKSLALMDKFMTKSLGTALAQISCISMARNVLHATFLNISIKIL
jgi:hypothetical protein